MEDRARAHTLRKSATSADAFTAALDAEEISHSVRRERVGVGGGEHRTRIDVRVRYAGGWESCKPFYEPA